jgi:hypothetical protein
LNYASEADIGCKEAVESSFREEFQAHVAEVHDDERREFYEWELHLERCVSCNMECLNKTGLIMN